MIHIETSRLLMSQIQQHHWPLFLRLHQEEEVIRYAFDQPSEAEIRSRFDSRLPQWRWGSEHWLCLVIRDSQTEQAIGITGLCISEAETSEIEVGYLLLPEFHGCGYGTESLLGLKQYVQDHFPVAAITAIVTDGNVASCKVLEKSGFELAEREKNAYRIGNQVYDDLQYRCQLECAN
ncbi:GNAT family N-acetyltransferase [Vibrio sp.]|uniref:GNAT family N-acetyltransferase n=1 Tax=Vibrio sp. TaxID=678 RepID=UPI003D0F2DB8